MVLIYNLADTFFIGQTNDALQVAAVSLAIPVFLMFMSVGTIFGIGGTSVISTAMGEKRENYAKKHVPSVCGRALLSVLSCRACFYYVWMIFLQCWEKCRYMELCS